MSGQAIYNDLKRFSNDVHQTVHKAVRDVAYYYPKTLVIANIVSIVFTILFPSFTSMLGLGLSLYFIYPLKNCILASIAVHNENNISEFSSSPAAKEALIPAILLREATANFRALFNF